MQNKFLLGVLLLVCIPMMGIEVAQAQANRTNSGDVVCPATGTSIEVLPARNSRYSMIINNIAANAIRLGYLDTGTTALTNANAWIIQPGQATADSVPGVLNKRVVCMSTAGVSATITFNETYR